MTKLNELSGTHRRWFALMGFLAALPWSAALVAQTTPVPAPTEEETTEEEEVPELEEVVVTGSRIARPDFEGPSPIRVINVSDLPSTGRTSVSEVLRELPEQGAIGINEGGTITAVRGATGLNLRNLGTNNTLVLVNGRRTAPWGVNSGGVVFVDPNMIPLSAIDRIDVVKDGASAVYGADATAGVVNIITKRDFNGMEVGGSYTNSFDSSTDISYAYLVGGATSGKTSALVTANYRQRASLGAQERDFSANADLRERYRGKLIEWYPDDFGNDEIALNNYLNNFDLRSGAGPNATITGRYFVTNPLTRVVSTTPQTNPLTGQPVVRVGTGSTAFLPGTVLPGYTGANTVQQGQRSSASVPLGSANDGTPTAAEFVSTTGFAAGPTANTNRYNYQEFVWLTPNEESYGTFAVLRHDATDWLSIFADVMYKRDTFQTRLAPSPISTAGDNDIFVPATNFYNPFGIDVSFTYRPVDIGARIANITADTFALTAGLEGKAFDDWTWDFAGRFSTNEVSDKTTNAISESRMRAVLNRSTSNALNIFGGANYRNPESVLNEIRVVGETSGSSQNVTYDFSLQGSLFELPGDWGKVRFAVYGEYREEEFNEANSPLATTLDDIIGQVRLADATAASREARALAGEILLPLLPAQRIPGFYALELNLAGRYEEFSDGFDAASTPKVSARWQPIKELLLRASWGEGYRVPSLPQLYGGERQSLPNGLADPMRPASITGNSQDSASFQRLVRARGNPFLQAEESENYSFGFVFEADDKGPFKFLRGFDIGFQAWSYEQTNIITTSSNSTIIRNAALGNPGFVPLVTRAPGTETYTNNTGGAVPNVIFIDGTIGTWAPGETRTVPGVIQEVLNGVVNQATNKTKGYDLEIGYSRRFTFGEISLQYNATWVESYENQATPTSAINEFAGTDGIPEYRGTFGVTWDYEDYFVGLSHNFTSEYGNLDIDGYEIDSYQTVDLRFGWDLPWKVLGGTELSFGILNLFDEEPPLYYDGVGYDQSMIGDVRGRQYFFSFRQTF